MKYPGNLKKVILLFVKRGWLKKDPFMGYKMVRRQVEKCFLVQDESNAFASKRLNSKRLSLVQDMVLFSCYTGLAYADVQKLKRSEIRTGDSNLTFFSKEDGKFEYVGFLINGFQNGAWS